MGEINLSRDKQDAIKSIDTRELDKLVEEAIRYEELGDLYSLPLERCGPYVSDKLRLFREALVDHRKAKAAKKREETRDALRRAARYLTYAVADMKCRLEEEETDRQFFYVDDQIIPPYRFSERLEVRVRYQWRRTLEEQWTHGSITFVHDVVSRPDYLSPKPTGKPSAAQRERDRQSQLWQTWDQLMKGALYSMRDYFRDGGDGSKIPEIFQATVDAHRGGLNNYSTRFWRQQP